MSNPSPEVMKLAREMREGLEGVTPGPWREWEGDGYAYAIGGRYVEDVGAPIVADICIRKESGENARHIARCHPNNIRLLLDHIEAQEADRVSCQARIEELEQRVAHYEQHETKAKRPFSDRFAQQTIDNQVKEIDRLHSAIATLRARLADREGE